MGRNLLLIFFALCSLSHADKILRVSFSDPSQSKVFDKFAQDNNIDVWSLRRDSADVSVSKLEEDLVKRIYNASELVSDVDKAVEEEMAENSHTRRMARRQRASASPTSYFARFDEIISWLQRLDRENDFVSLRSIGKTYEGRDMKIVRIGTGAETKPAVFITGGIHAREWLATATVAYFVEKLVTGMQRRDPRIVQLVGKYDFYVSSVSNPDGYEYTFQKTRGARSWRKTRSMQAYGCIGADPNRNFDVEFGRKGASRDPCNLIYPGPRPFSEKCVANLRDFALSNSMRGRIKLFYDVHAYSQMYFVPFAYDRYRKPADDREMRRVAGISNQALMRVNGRHFLLGTPGEILYDASGSTMDWFKLKAGAKYSFAFEVFPDMRSRIGFLARTSDIRPSGEEISEAIFTAAENIRI